MARSSAMLLALLSLPACSAAPEPRCPETPPARVVAPPSPAPKAPEPATTEPAAPDGSRFKLSIRVKPIVDPAAIVEVEITARGPASDLDTWTIAAPAKGSLKSVSAQDGDGTIAVTTTEVPAPAGAPIRGSTSAPTALHLQLARPPLGPLKLAYSLTTKPISMSNTPAVELDPDRFRALGEALIALPDESDEGSITASLSIDSSDLGEAIRAASSFGVGATREAKVRAADLRDMVLVAGHMGTAVFEATEGHDEAAWVGYTTFDPRPIAADVASFRTAIGQLFHEPLPELSTLLIFADGRPAGQFIAARRAGGVVVQVGVGEPWSAPVRIAVAAEVIKAWIGERLWIGPTEPERDVEARWFTEGVTRHLARDLLFRFGLITPTELLDEVNGLESVLALSPLKAETNAGLAKRARDPGALPLLVARGALYATRIDALLRKKKAKTAAVKDKEITGVDKGKPVAITSLDLLLRVLYEKAQEKRGPLPTSAWTEAIAKALDKTEADAFAAIIEKGGDPKSPDDALGPCFKGGARRFEAFDLGFDLDATRSSAGEDTKEKIAGVRAGGPAAKAGLRDGDTLVDAKITNGRSDVPVTLTIERDGKKKTITYRPAGPSVSGHGWSRIKDVSDDACVQ